MQSAKRPCLPVDVDEEGETCFFTQEQERNRSAVSPQYLTTSSIHSSPPHSAVPTPIPLNHLTDPVTGKIILSAVLEEMKIFAQAYNRMLDTLGTVIQVAERALQS
ncbi:hypothetical protein EDD16DRAFT_1722108 [Pisolithus croceorrhizus]|nr:hypothetical protein EDD16DRAFT_1722108 [Pisolithus croceorrhizus]KAI6115433.1 hypothetical protein EV401DRAFT_2073562 [Pisolithus croceorrhizus]KAI6137451.1 hypothetical protein EDD17DRAFT_1771676 [Pisolithus thermaeus]